MPYESIFIDRASNGTPRARLNEEFKTKAPELYNKIYEAYNRGEVYTEGDHAYKIVANEQYGDTVYQNPAPKFKKPAIDYSARFTAIDTKLEEILRIIKGQTVL